MTLRMQFQIKVQELLLKSSNWRWTYWFEWKWWMQHLYITKSLNSTIWITFNFCSEFCLS